MEYSVGKGDITVGRTQRPYSNRKTPPSIKHHAVDSSSDLKNLHKKPFDAVLHNIGNREQKSADSKAPAEWTVYTIKPGRSFVERPGSPSAMFQDYLRRKIVEQKEQMKIRAIELASLFHDRFQTQGGRWYHPHEGHLTSAGHRVVADILDLNHRKLSMKWIVEGPETFSAPEA